MPPGRKLRLHLLALACLGLVSPVPGSAQAPIGEVVAADATVKGSVVLASTGTRVMSGSSITAGQTTASLRLARGGEVRVCPRSSVSLTSSQRGRDLMVGMGTGTIEAHYALGSTADTIMTPDFRILLAGPGKFHVAIAADSRGNTCVRSLEGNSASVLITEIMGDGVFQVLPGEQAYFRNGRVATMVRNVPPDCGCPAPVPMMNAQQDPVAPAAVPPQAPPVVPQPAPAASQHKIELPANSAEGVLAQFGTPVVAPSPAPDQTPATSPNGEVHVQVDAPFVFRAEDAVAPAPVVARLTLGPMPDLFNEPMPVSPPKKPAPVSNSQPAKQALVASKPQHKGFFGHVRSFFAAIFR